MGTDETDIFFRYRKGLTFLKGNLRKKAVCSVSPGFSTSS